MKQLIATGLTAALLSGCGGSSAYAPSAPSAAPASTPAPTSTGSTVTISIVGSIGNQAYNPNPSQVPQGGQVMWANRDAVAHHVVMDDGSADLGVIAPGATSRTITLSGSGGNYHCTIHPSMVGSINGQSAPQPNCPNGYCG